MPKNSEDGGFYETWRIFFQKNFEFKKKKFSSNFFTLISDIKFIDLNFFNKIKIIFKEFFFLIRKKLIKISYFYEIRRPSVFSGVFRLIFGKRQSWDCTYRILKQITQISVEVEFYTAWMLQSTQVSKCFSFQILIV